jgi:hypothetical protein
MGSRTGPDARGGEQSELEELRRIIRVNRSDIDELQAQARRIDDLEARLDSDAALIGGVLAEGLVAHEQVAQLEEALRTSRTIGTALGIIMADRQVDEREAFALLSKRSQDTNRKLRVLAEEVVRHGDSRVVLGA